MTPRLSQRRAPLTTVPTCGTSTKISKNSDSKNSPRAWRSHSAMGTWNASSAATNAITRAKMWRTRKCVGAILPKRGLSGRAMEAE